MNVLIDIGSTMVKVARLDTGGNVASYDFHKREYDHSIYTQVSGIIDRFKASNPNAVFSICSSANGGLRVGIVCLTKRFSGNVAKNLALAAGGNVLFTDDVDHPSKELPEVDALIVVGGIDSPDADHMRGQMAKFDDSTYSYQTLVYAGNEYLASEFTSKFPHASVVANPLSQNLDLACEDLLEKVRDLYLDDIVEKQGVSKLQAFSAVPIWPTPAIVNLASDHIGRNGSTLQFSSPSIVLDIGGATTDAHFGMEVIDEKATGRSNGFRAYNRHVFTELGVFASLDSTVTKLSEHPRLYEFIRTVYGESASRNYAQFREGEVPEDMLFYGCFFLAFDSLSSKSDKGSPTLRLGKINSIVLTGGASQRADKTIMSELTRLLLPSGRENGIEVVLDSDYQIWLDGMKRLPSLVNGSNGITAA